jgi:hypothetical protein
LVTGEPEIRQCEDVRGDQMTCGRKGELYAPVEVSIKPGLTRGGDVMGVERALLNRGRARREDLG